MEMDNRPLWALIEAILFASDEPMPFERLKETLSATEQEIQEAFSRLEDDYRERGISLQKISGGYQILTRPQYEDIIQRAKAKKTSTTLSKGAMETLAFIAYRQPCTRQDVEEGRGVNAEASIETLLEKGLIKEVGRKKTLGRPKLFGTTQEFLRKFGLNDLSDLPPLSS